MVTKIKTEEYDKIAVSVSGGSDSDIIVDMFTKCDPDGKVKYVFFDTGLEYEATKTHLSYLEKRYGINIERKKAIKSIPTSCKQFGQPFLSKFVSEMIERLQKHNFKWEDEPYEELMKKYPKCKSAIQWWACGKGDGSRFNITQNKLLKEFMIQNPPDFKISNKCCKYAKKDVGKKFNEENCVELSVTGVRRSEGGIRASRYKSCFDKNNETHDDYRLLYYFTDNDKQEYDEFFGVIHSDCYIVWGMTRTGCVGCPFGRNLEQELNLVKIHEPNLYFGVCNVFKDTYEYTRKYQEFKEGYKHGGTKDKNIA